MDSTKLFYIVATAVVFGAIAGVIGWLGSRTNKAALDQGINSAHDNTKAIEENTAAIRELIAKLDERKV